MSVRHPVQPSRADDRSLGQLLSAATQDVSHLVRQEIQLAKVETREELRVAARAGAMFGAAGVAALLALFLLAFAAAWGLAEVMPAGVAFLIVGLVVGVAGTWAFIVGRRRLETFDPMPQETAQTIKEDLEWIRTHAGTEARDRGDAEPSRHDARHDRQPGQPGKDCRPSDRPAQGAGRFAA